MIRIGRPRFKNDSILGSMKLFDSGFVFLLVSYNGTLTSVYFPRVALLIMILKRIPPHYGNYGMRD